MGFRVHTSPLLVWAAREVIRRPYQAVLLGSALALLVVVMGAAVLLSHALSSTASTLLEGSPSLVIRRVNAGGWAPMPSEIGVNAARSVPGVVDASIRVWGVAATDNGPVTIVGIDDAARKISGFEFPQPVPEHGEAVIGAGVDAKSGTVKLSAQKRSEFKVVGSFDADTDMATHDLVLISQEDARDLLGIPANHGSDLAVYVLHKSEEEAIIPDLSAAFPWPVHVVTRTQTVGAYTAGSARRGGIALITMIPAVLALALLVTATVRDALGRREEVGLLKAMGWTTRDVVRLHLLSALLVAAPALAAGMLVAYGLVLWPGSSWVGYLLLGWRTSPPELHLNASDALLILCEVAALVVLPYFVATLWPALKGAAADPQELL